METFTILSSPDRENTTLASLKTSLESHDEVVKIDTMKKILLKMLSGESVDILMHVIRFILPHKSKTLKKLLSLYWELCEKTKDGKLKQEMLLVWYHYSSEARIDLYWSEAGVISYSSHALRNDLLHPNEFIRGQTLRLMCKLKETEILEPLVPSIRLCLDHKHPYVRKNAVLAISAIYKSFESLIPDAPEVIYTYLGKESDGSCKRNAIVALMNVKMSLAVDWFTLQTSIENWDEYLQLIVIELIRKDAGSPGSDRAKYIQTVFGLLTVSSPSVRYDAASTLVALTQHVSAIKAAVATYIELAIKESDNNVKLIVLDRIDELRVAHGGSMFEVPELLRVVSSQDLGVRRKALEIVMALVSSRNVDEVVVFLKKELVKTHDGKYEKNNEYRHLLIQSIHSCAIQYLQVADSVVTVLMAFLTDSSAGSGVDVIAFVREVLEKFPRLQSQIVSHLLETFESCKTGRVFRGALWIIGEYCTDKDSILSALEKIRGAVGEVPILASELKHLEPVEEVPTHKDEKIKTVTKVLADGTYATQTAYSNPRESLVKDTEKPPLRALFLEGDFFVAAVLASCLVKLVLRLDSLKLSDDTLMNSIKTEVMLMITSIIRLGKSDIVKSPMDEDSFDRLVICLNVLSGFGSGVEPVLQNAFLNVGRSAFSRLIQAKDLDEKKKKTKDVIKAQVDDPVSFRFLKTRRGGGDTALLDAQDLTKATGTTRKLESYTSKLSKVMPLTGHSDPVYAEAYVTVHQFDILLDIMIVNQTASTLQNMSVEFSTLGDLKLVERPTPVTLAPHGFHTLKANIKVSSTETGIIFGSIVYDGAHGESGVVILSEIHIDIMDYIQPAPCDELKFRTMWTEFEWENKVSVASPISDLKAFLDHILKTTNMNCLTPAHALSGDCGFLSANLYARSIFGEDALANISLEVENGKVSGHVRIRSKTQGIALSLGDKITLSHKIPIVV